MTLADCTVMVVEDHEFQRRTTLQMLANLGVGGAAGGRRRRRRARAARARRTSSSATSTCPGMDGVEFLRHVSETRAGTAIVIASGPRRERAAQRRADRPRVRPRRARRDPQAAHRAPPAGGRRPAPPAGGRAAGAAGRRARDPPRGRASADGRAAAIEVRGATPAEAADARRRARSRGEPVGDRRRPRRVRRERAASRSSSTRVTDDLLELDPTRITISILDGPALPEAPLALLTRLQGPRLRARRSPTSAPGGRRCTTSRKLPLTEVQLAAQIVQRATEGSAEALAATVEALHHQGVTRRRRRLRQPGRMAAAARARRRARAGDVPAVTIRRLFGTLLALCVAARRRRCSRSRSCRAGRRASAPRPSTTA